MWTFVSIVVLLLMIIIYFRIPFSPLKSDFNKQVSTLISNTKESTDLFAAEEVENFPAPVKKYFETCGFIGIPKMSYMKTVHKDVDFLLSADKPYTKIDYTQYTFVNEPARYAFIDTSISGMPFQGVDSYIGGIGGMKGVIAKTFTLFNQTGTEMDTACLVNVLSECLLVPSIALQEYIVWESVDDTHAKATIAYYGISASGTFTFSEYGELISFTTNDRWEVETDGTKTQAPWSMLFSEYEMKNGIRQPTRFRTVWHYDNGDSVYFDSKNPTIEYH